MRFALVSRNDGEWPVGRLRGTSGVFSQRATVEEPDEHNRDAYPLANAEAEPAPPGARTKCVEIGA